MEYWRYLDAKIIIVIVTGSHLEMLLVKGVLKMCTHVEVWFQ